VSRIALTAASAMLAAVVVSACGDTDRTAPAFDLVPLATLGDSVGEGAIASVPTVSPRIAGRWYYVATPWGSGTHAPRRYASTNGAFEGIVGASSAFGTVEMIHASGDTVLLHDLDRMQMTFLAAPDSVLRTVPWLERPYSLHGLSDGSFVITTGDFSAGPPMLHVSRDGALLREFGTPIETPNTESRYRLFAASRTGGFWSARVSRQLELQKWSAPGVLESTVALNAEWFPRYEREARFGPAVPPSPMLVAFWEDDAGMIWIVGAAPDPQWSDGLGAAVTGEGGQEYYPVVRPDETFDTVIERWDPVKQVRLSSQRLDAFYYTSPEPWTLLSATGNSGVRRIGVWRMQLR
jgi:hypothetical protein